MNDMNQEHETTEYQVLARKYRPTNFDDLVGQQALVRTLTNALKVGRIASAFVLTGVRGVGKTTTARIIAKALNCDTLDSNGNPPIKPCGGCNNCYNIAVGTHMDVMEMDAASHTSIDDIRDIIDSAQYKPVSARYKVFILDEVHMLSKSAFNALLKILEEPPAHVKFILATTDIDKVPVTVLSRCQRFDLRRITVQDLISLYTKIGEQEGFDITPDALRTIAVSADGSARDGLSILDQALALSADRHVDMDLVVSMLGLADKQATYTIFKSLMTGDVPSVLSQVDTLYLAGADAMAILHALVDVNWLLTRYKHTPAILDELSVSEIERTACVEMAKDLDIPTLTRTWQVLQKGIAECTQTERPIMALEMVLIRIAYMAQMPSVESLVKSVQSAPKHTADVAPQQPTPQPTPAPTDDVSHVSLSPSMMPSAGDVAPPKQTNPTLDMGGSTPLDAQPSPDTPLETKVPENFRDWVSVLKQQEPIQGNALFLNARLVEYTPPKVSVAMQNATREDIQRIRQVVQKCFGNTWHLDVVKQGGEAPLKQQDDMAQQKVLDDAEKLPEIQAVKQAFPNAVVQEIEPLDTNDTIYETPQMDV